MPGMDNTGPLGTGPVGRGQGPCRGEQDGRGRGRGFRRGGGAGWVFSRQALSSDNEKEFLEQRKGWLETQLAAIAQKLQGLEEKSNG